MGINYEDTIVVRRVSNKGTKIEQAQLKSVGLFSEEAKKRDIDRLKLAGDLMIMSNKGTKTISSSTLENSKIPDIKGHYISTGKGTGRIKL